MNETFGEHSLLDYAWAWSGVECRRNRGNLYSLAVMENKLFVVTFECLQFISIERTNLVSRDDEWESKQVDRLIINYFVIQIPDVELIIYAFGENLIKHWFSFVRVGELWGFESRIEGRNLIIHAKCFRKQSELCTWGLRRQKKALEVRDSNRRTHIKATNSKVWCGRRSVVERISLLMLTIGIADFQTFSGNEKNYKS